MGTLVLTTALRTAGELGLTRMDLPFLLGTIVSTDRTRANALGYAMHFVAGQVFALVYFGIFTAIGHRSWWLGAVFGLAHGLLAGIALVNVLLPVIHPRMGTPLSSRRRPTPAGGPGFMMLNDGRRTPLATIAAHIAYGAIGGGFVSLAA